MFNPRTKSSEPSTRVIVQTGNPLSENEIKAAFRGNENAQWYKALIQIIDNDRHNEALNAAMASESNNAGAAFTANGAYKFATGLMLALGNYVEGED